MKKETMILAMVTCLMVSQMVMADDWPQWRGINRDGISKEKNLLKVWPDSGPELIWSFEGLGGGYSSMSISKGMIFTTGMIEEKEAVFALDLDGRVLWKTVYGERWDDSFEFARSTPTLDGNNLYVVSGTGELVCLTRDTGNIVWSVDPVTQFSAEYHSWGVAESPLVVDNMVVCSPGGKEASVVAYDKETGKLIWQTNDLSDGSDRHGSPTTGGLYVIAAARAG